MKHSSKSAGQSGRYAEEETSMAKLGKGNLLGASSSLVAALTMGLWGASAVQTASAQDSEDDIVVTGSYIRGTPEDAALPVDVISAQDLQQQGSPQALELIKSLPIVGPVLGDSNQFSAAAQGASGAGTLNLRGIGANRTLVLLNGRRIGPSLAGAVDTNLLPVNAIGRIEILKDGAAATYGSDAIAGVANFITRRDLDGLEVAGEYRAIEGSDGDWTGALNWGWRGERSNIFTSFGYQHRSELTSLDRDWANRPYTVNPTGWSILGNPGAFLPTASGVPTAGVQRDANCAAVGGFPTFSATTPACYFTYVPFDNLVEEQNQFQWYGELNSEIADGIDLHIEAFWSRNEIPGIRFSPAYPPTQGPNGPGSVGAFTVPANNPGAQTAMTQVGMSAGAIAATNLISLTLWRPLGNGGNIATGGGQIGYRDYDQWRVSGGLTGELWDTGIGWDIAATYSESNIEQGTTDILIERLRQALRGYGSRVNAADSCTAAEAAVPANAGNNAVGCYWYNPFSNAYPTNLATGATNPGFVPANANNPEVVAWLFDLQKINIQQSQLVVDLVFNGETGLALGGGNVAWAAGTQWRSSEYRQSLGSLFYDADQTPCPLVGDFTCSVRTGPYIFLGQNRPQMLDDNVYAVFGELNFPFTDDLNAQLAVR
jgi:iron complex outermembrane recepter protein